MFCYAMGQMENISIGKVSKVQRKPKIFSKTTNTKAKNIKVEYRQYFQALLTLGWTENYTLLLYNG